MAYDKVAFFQTSRDSIRVRPLSGSLMELRICGIASIGDRYTHLTSVQARLLAKGLMDEAKLLDEATKSARTSRQSTRSRL